MNSRLHGSHLFISFARILLLTILAIVVWIAVSNLDLCVRLVNSYKKGTLTIEKVHLDLAAFDLNQHPVVDPIKAQVSKADGMVEVYVPKGRFTMGSNRDPHLPNYPEHVVFLDAYWIDQTEVSNAMYLKCIGAGKCSRPAISR